MGCSFIAPIQSAVGGVLEAVGAIPIVGDVIQVAAPVVGAVFGGPVGAAIGGAIAGAMEPGGGLEGALAGAAGGYVGGSLAGMAGTSGLVTSSAGQGSIVSGITGLATGGVEGGITGAIGGYGVGGGLSALGSSGMLGTNIPASISGGTVGDMASMYQNAYGMSAADAMAAAESASASGMTASQLAGMMSSSGMLTPTQIGNFTGNSNLADYAKLAQSGITPQQVAANKDNPSWLDTVTKATGLSTSQLGSIASTGLNLAGGYLQGQSATEASQIAANAQIEAARIAAEASKFKPVGVTTRFGQSQFGYDAAGNLTSAGYQLSPEARAQQDALMGISGQALGQFQNAGAATASMGRGAQGMMGIGETGLGYGSGLLTDAERMRVDPAALQTATAPMGTAAQSMFGLGQGYLQTSPQAQAAQYMSEQQALLAPGRERDLAQLQAQMQAQGRGGLAVGGTSTGMGAANPQLEAYYNAKRQQDLQLAAQATQGGQQYAQFGTGMIGQGAKTLQDMYGTQTAAYDPYKTALGVGMDYTKFGAGMLGAGGQLQREMYGTQTAAYAPYQTALGGATSLEALGQQPMDIGTAIGAKTSTAAAQAGMLQAQGIQGAAQTMQPANAYSPWGAMLSGAGQAVGQYGQPQQYQYDPYTGQQIKWGA